MTRIHYCFIVVALMIAPGCERRDASPATPDEEGIVEIFKRGLQTNKENNPDLPDADMFGAALVSMAWGRFEKCPDAAPEMFKVFERFVSQSELSARYQQWNVFVENIEPALLNSKDAEHLRKNWQVRQKAIEAQRKSLQEWVGGTVAELDNYAKALSALEDPAKIQAFEKRDEVEMLFDLFDSDEVTKETGKPLAVKANEIAKIIDKKLSGLVVHFEQLIEAERKKDLPGSAEQFAPKKESETEGLTVWKKGKYQELLERLIPLVALRDNPTIAFWNDHRTADEVDDVEESDGQFLQYLVVAYQEVQRLQKIRYNLWVVRVLSSNSTIKNLSIIDTGLLEPSVGALYSTRENELITQQLDQRAGEIQRILLQNKVTLEAF